MPYKIIVADSSPTLHKIVQGAFPEPEFRLFPFENGTELAASAAGIRPDAVLLSLSLEGGDGYDVGLAIRNQAETRRVPLFFLKGAFEVLDAGRVAAIDPEGIVTKPFDSEKVVADVRLAIERRTTPTSLPEEPVWRGSGDGRIVRGTPEKGQPVPGRPDTGKDRRDAAAANLFPNKGGTPPQGRVREWVRAEICELERELEKRIRARIMAELQGASPNPGDYEKR